MTDVKFKVGDVFLETFEEIYDHECHYDYDESPQAELWYNDSKVITLEFSEACELADMSYDNFMKGLQYCMDIHKSFEAWKLAEDNFACHNYEDSINDMVYSQNPELQALPKNLIHHFDFKSYWDCDLRHDYTTTDDYVFFSR